MNNLKRLHEYLCKLNPWTHEDALLLSALVKIAQVAGINRVQVSAKTISHPGKTTPANIYGISFLDSGSGKDKPLRDIDYNIIPTIRDDFAKRALRYKETRTQMIENEANNKYGDKSTVEKNKFISQNSPRFLPFEISDATIEGFIATREAFQDAHMGSVFIKISEFGDYITSNNDRRLEFLSMVSEVYDYGDSNPKVLKSEKESIPVYGVPSSIMFHTAPAGLLEGKNREKLFNFLNRGLARRSFICYPIHAKKSLTSKDIDTLAQQAEIDSSNITESFNRMYELTKPVTDDDISTIADTYATNFNTFTFTQEANDLLGEYQVKNQEEAQEIPENSDEVGLKAEQIGRHWKVLKLAGVLSAFEHPDDKNVYPQDVEDAIRICAIFSAQVRRFYRARPTDELTKLFDFFLLRKNQWLSTMDLRNENFVYKGKFAQWLPHSLSMVAEMADDAGFVFEHKKKGGPGNMYRITYLAKDADKDKHITYSQGATNNPTEVTFTKSTISFTKFHTVTLQNKAWSCATFKDNYRSDENATGEIDLIALDVDSGMKFDEAKAIFAERKITSLIVTTRTHQRAKGDKAACDRFRIIIPLYQKVMVTKEDHTKKLKALAKELNIPIDPSACNISRLWFGNQNQIHHYTEGSFIDLSVIPTSEIIQRAYTNMTFSLANTDPLNTWFQKNYELCGGRNNALIRALKHYQNDEGCDRETVKDMVVKINAGFDEPLDMKEIERTVFKSLK